MKNNVQSKHFRSIGANGWVYAFGCIKNIETATDVYTVLCAAFPGTGKF